MTMKSELAAKLKEVLDSMSQEDFDKEWSSITELNLEGPTFNEAIEYLSLVQNQLSNFEMVNTTSVPVEDNNTYALAA